MTTRLGGESIRIGDVAKLTGISVDALRYYDREGLLPSPVRSPNGARRFPPDVVSRVRFVKQAQAAGLTLRDIKQLVAVQRGRGRGACQRMRSVMSERLEEIDGRVQQLQVFRGLLERYRSACDEALACGDDPACPSLDALAQSHK
jgi:DNA-binding transcriptional MerR regulator